MDFLNSAFLIFIVGFLAAGILGFTMNSIREWRLRVYAKNFRQTLEDRIGELISSLRKAVKVISEIETEIQERQNLVSKLQKDFQLYNEVIKLNESEVEAVVQLLRGELRKEGKRSFWIDFGIGLFFFVLGVVTTLIIGQ